MARGSAIEDRYIYVYLFWFIYAGTPELEPSVRAHLPLFSIKATRRKRFPHRCVLQMWTPVVCSVSNTYPMPETTFYWFSCVKFFAFTNVWIASKHRDIIVSSHAHQRAQVPAHNGWTCSSHWSRECGPSAMLWWLCDDDYRMIVWLSSIVNTFSQRNVKQREQKQEHQTRTQLFVVFLSSLSIQQQHWVWSVLASSAENGSKVSSTLSDTVGVSVSGQSTTTTSICLPV